MESPVVTATAGLLRLRVHTEVHTCCGQVGLRLLQEPRSTDAEGGEYAYVYDDEIISCLLGFGNWC
mgnify:CR=1 FL=1